MGQEVLWVGYRSGASGRFETCRLTALCMCRSSNTIGQEKVGDDCSIQPFLPSEEIMWLAKLEELGATSINLTVYDKGGEFNCILHSNKLHTTCHLFKMLQE